MPNTAAGSRVPFRKTVTSNTTAWSWGHLERVVGTGSGVINFSWGVHKWGPLRWAQKDKGMEVVL